MPRAAKSLRQQQRELSAEMRARQCTWSQIAEEFRTRYRVNVRAALRMAHDWSQRDAAEQWNLRWPDDPKNFKNFSYWELWPGPTGYAPSLDVLARLAELYERSVSDLVRDCPDFRATDEAYRATPANTGAAPRFREQARREIILDAAMLSGTMAAQGLANRMSGDSSTTARKPPRGAKGTQELHRLENAVAEVHRRYQATHYSMAMDALPVVTAGIDNMVDGPRSDQRHHALLLRCRAAVVEAKLHTKFGRGTAALRAAERVQSAAEEIGDEHALAASAYQRACALLRLRKAAMAENESIHRAESIAGTDPISLTWRGALTLLAAVIAAKRHDAKEAERRLDHAHQLAGNLGVDGNIWWTAFGPANVLIHRMAVATALSDPHGVLAAAERIDITAMPAGLCGREAQYHLDSAYAHAHLHDDQLAVIHLLDTERVAPELLFASQEAHNLIGELMARERRHAVPGLRGLAIRTGAAV